MIILIVVLIIQMNYPIAHNLDVGGCGHTQPPTIVPYNGCAQRVINERSGNNPYTFQLNRPNVGEYGTGCMNPACTCKDCQGDCICARGASIERFGFNDILAKKDWMFWLIAFASAYLIYHYLKTRRCK